MKIPQKWKVAAVVLLGPTLALMDGTIISVILPQLQTAFHTDIHTITWVANGYFLAEAAILPIVGYLSDRIGSKVAFLIALALFTVDSLLCAISPVAEALIVFRVLQGIGGGALLPLAMAINYRNFPPNERSKITAILGIPMVMAPTFGPTIGGYLTTSLNWNAVFLINVPFGIIGLLLAFLILPGRTSDQGKQAKAARKSFDIPGLLLSLVGVTTLVYGISEAGTTGWGDTTVLTALLTGAAILIVFVVVELRVSDPVLDLRLFLNYTFTITSILTWLIVGVFNGGLFLLPFFLENVRGYTALTMGTLLIGQGLATTVGVVITGRLYNRVGPRILVVCGLLFLLAGTYGLTQINVNTTGQDLQVWLILRGLGLGLIFQPLNTLALSVVSNKGMAKASSLVSVTRQVAIAAAVAALTTYLTERSASYGVGPQAITAGMTDTFWVVLILGLVCIPPALVMGRDPAIEAIKKAQQAKAGGDGSQSLQATELAQEGRNERPSEPLFAPQPLHVHIPTVPGLSLRADYTKPLLRLPALSPTELDGVLQRTTMRNSLTNRYLKQQKEHQEQDQHMIWQKTLDRQEQDQHMIWQKTLDRYANEIAALQAELEGTRADIDQRMDAYSVHLQKLSRAISQEILPAGYEQNEYTNAKSTIKSYAYARAKAFD